MAPTDLSTSNPQINKFRISDFLNVGNLFNYDQSNKGASNSTAINDVVDSAGAGAMSYAMANKGGATGLQKKLNRADAGFHAATTAISMVPGVGTAASLALEGANWLGGKMAKGATKIGLGDTIGGSSGYTGTASNIGSQTQDINAYNNAGGFAKLFGNRGKMNALTSKLKQQQGIGTNILQEAQRQMGAMGNTSQNIGMANTLKFNNLPTVAIGKNGLNTEFIAGFRKFKTGGKIEEPQNVIVDGKLHKELNHMGENLTKKGIPVVEMGEGGELGEQKAELERDEIILHLQLTKKLEELEKEGSEESMIEAGKILVKEILKNTKDSKSKLLKTVE